MNSDSLKKPVDLQGLSLALAKTKADYLGAIQNAPHSDWAQNDSSKSTYIENRTHYSYIDYYYNWLTDYEFTTTGVIKTLSWSALYDISPDLAFQINGDGFIEGETYTVTYNGTSYDLVCYVFNDSSLSTCYCLGDSGHGTTSMQADTAHADANVPFMLYQTVSSTSGANKLTFRTDGAGTYTVTIVGPAVIYEKLDSQYLDGKLIQYGSGVRSEVFNNSNNIASGTDAHAEGYYTTASGGASHSQGYYTVASGSYSSAEGDHTTSAGYNSHSEGRYTTASHKSQHVFGEHNIQDPSTAAASERGNYVEIVGNGTSPSAQSNARTLDWSGNEVLAGKLTVGAAPTETMDVATKGYVDDAVASAENVFMVIITVDDEKGVYSADHSLSEVYNNYGKYVYGIDDNGNFYSFDFDSASFWSITEDDGIFYNVFRYSNPSEPSETALTFTFYELVENTELSGYLSKTNTASYTPTANYHPATKKYVDDATAGITTNLAGLTDTTISSPADGQVLTYDGTNQVWVNGESGGAYYVTITSTTSEGVTTYTADKTYAEVEAAYNSGKSVYAVNGTNIFSLVTVSSGGMAFSKNTATVLQQYLWTKSTGTITYTSSSLANFQAKLTFDSAPTANSTNPVTSGGVYTALQSAGATYSLSISGSTITLTGTDGTTSSVSLPIYDGSVTEVWQGGVY